MSSVIFFLTVTITCKTLGILLTSIGEDLLDIKLFPSSVCSSGTFTPESQCGAAHLQFWLSGRQRWGKSHTLPEYFLPENIGI